MRYSLRMNASAAKPDRTLMVILSIIAALVIVSLVVVFSRGEPKLLDRSTPEGVVQRYAAAVIEGDESAAVAYLTQSARGRCDKLARTATDNVRVTLVSTTKRAASADVKVSIITSFSDSGPFGASEGEAEDVFDLVKVDGQWQIDTVPWQLNVCLETKTAP